MSSVMDKWFEDSRRALATMERELAEQNAAVETAMAAIRRHSDAIERLEQNIAVIRTTLEACGQPEVENLVTRVDPRSAGAAAGRPAAPPLRPVGTAPPPRRLATTA